MPRARLGGGSLRHVCRNVTGRLIEIELRDGGYRSVAEVDEVTSELTALISKLESSVRPVVIADWRACKVLTPEVSERAIALMSSTNARIERSAILHAGDASTSVLQLVRLIRETNAPHRRLFTETHQLHAWLAEVLDTREQERLREFVLRPRPSATAR